MATEKCNREHVECAQFSYNYYRYFLKTALIYDYKISSFRDYSPKYDKTIILRHDIDYSLNGVLQLAQIEAALGVSATYLFRVHAHEYNLFSHYVYKLLQELQSLGHEIGLHSEAMTFARALEVEASEVLLQEKKLLETILGNEVLTISEHRDISHIVHNTPYFHDNNDPYEAGFKFFTMDPKYFIDVKYLSDSNGVWREGDPLKHINVHKCFQILIHPEWWYDQDLLLKGPYFHGLGN